MSEHIYLMQSADLFKIGIAGDAQKRRRQLQTGAAHPIQIVKAYPCDNARNRERTWHRRYASERVRGEWFRLSAEQVNMFIEEEAVRLLSEKDARLAEQAERIKDLQAALEHERGQSRELTSALAREQSLRLLTVDRVDPDADVPANPPYPSSVPEAIEQPVNRPRGFWARLWNGIKD